LRANASCAHFLEPVGGRSPRAVGDIAGKLAAGGCDLVAARLARGHGEAGALQYFGEAPDALGARARELGGGERVEGDQVELAAHPSGNAGELARVLVAVVHAVEHHVLEGDEVARRL